MQCAHCNAITNGKIYESRRIDGCVYRRRMCNKCLKLFVTVEITVPGMKINNRYRPDKRRAAPTTGSIKSDGLELWQAWLKSRNANPKRDPP